MSDTLPSFSPEQWNAEVEKYKGAYEDSMQLSVELSESLEEQIEEMNRLQLLREEESQRFLVEQNNMKQQFVSQLNELQEVAKAEQAAMTQTLQTEHQMELTRKDKQITQLEGQLKRLFEHHASESGVSTQNIQPATAPSIEDQQEQQKEVQRLNEENEKLQEKLTAEHAALVDLEMKYRFLERIKKALKDSTDQNNAEAQTKIVDLESQLKKALSSQKNINEPSVLVLESKVAELTREVVEVKDKNVSLTQQLASLHLEKNIDVESNGVKVLVEEQLSDTRKESATLRKEKEAICATLDATNNSLHELEVRLKQKDTYILELQKSQRQAEEKLEKEQKTLKCLQLQMEEAPPTSPTREEPTKTSALQTKILELQLSLQTHQSTICDLQQQRKSMQQELLQQNQIHQSELENQRKSKNSAEQKYQDILEKQVQKVQSYNQLYEELEEQLEQVSEDMKQYDDLKEQYIYQKEEVSALHAQLALKSKELAVSNELLEEERKNLEISKEISCNLQQRVLDVSKKLTVSQNELSVAVERFEALQLENVRQRKSFEREKAAIVFDLLQNQMESPVQDSSLYLSTPPQDTSPIHSYTSRTPRESSIPKEEQKSLSQVKQKLIEQMWKQSCEMVSPTVPKPIPLQ